MIQVRYPAKFEDLFNVFYRDMLSRYKDYPFKRTIIEKSIIEVDKEDFVNNEKSISFVLKLQESALLEYLSFLRDVEEIGKIPIKIRYISKMAQAYDADSGMFSIGWYELE